MEMNEHNNFIAGTTTLEPRLKNFKVGMEPLWYYTHLNLKFVMDVL